MRHPHHNSIGRQVRHLKMELFQDDTSTPSGNKRRSKPRWKIIKITGLIKSGLTDGYRLAHNLTTATHWAVGIRTPGKGHNRPHLHAAFLYPSKTRAALCRAFFIMVGCIEQPLKRLAGSFAGSANLIHSTAQIFALMGGGLTLPQRKPL